MPLTIEKIAFCLATNCRLERWARINTDGTVNVLSGKVEIGQCIVTVMAQMAADELDVTLERVRMVPVDTIQSPEEGVTSGSCSVEEESTVRRYACAELRDLFLQAAMRKLGTTLKSLSVDDAPAKVLPGIVAAVGENA